MSDQTWHYIDGAGAQHGPITIPQLQALVASGNVTAETQVWTEALGEQWIPAANVEGLLPAAPAAPATLVAPVRPTLITPASVAAVAQAATPAAVPTVRTAPITMTPESVQLQQPEPAATTPMIASTPTTQPVTGVPVPAPVPVAQQQQQQQPLQPQPQQQQPQQQQPQVANPYQSPAADPQQLEAGIYPATITKGGSMGLWSMLFFGGILCMPLGIMVAGMMSKGKEVGDTPALIGLGLVILGIACIAFSGILVYIYIYRAWKCLQPGGATISPGQAIGFMFIPLFQFYWVFKAIGGLPKQWNLITSSYPNTKNAPKLTFGAFICMLLIPVIGQIIWLSQIVKGINFMAGLHFQQSRPAGSALSGLGSRANFQ